MPASALLAKTASETNVIIAGAFFFFSYSLLKRSNAAYFPENAYAFAPDWNGRFGYSGEDVLAVTVDQSILIGATIANIISIISFGFLGSSVVTWACETIGARGKGFLVLNQLPIFNALIHTVEAGLFSAAILYENPELATYAGSSSEKRYFTAIGCLVLTGLASIQFLRVWIKSIGRDGRQKIEKKEQ
ncbi:UNVERIFIED_CONTAM: hypothetical protein HDU68_008762 [Siphonaria sp. JEL0065]|nr:hypothetical protein HDU68_008762 [Siphonaria sp. JEL0065]